MKKIITIITIISLISVSCKKENTNLIKPTTVYENLYDTVGTGKRFIDIYITNTNGNITNIFVNNTSYAMTTGSYVRAFNAYKDDTIKVICNQPTPNYIKVNIRKNYTSVVDTSVVSTYLMAKYIVK
jgi:hypothetical protein